MGLFSSDYGSGSSMNSSTAWGSQELDFNTFKSQLLNPQRTSVKAASFGDLASGRCTIEDVMQEFRMNGSDAPYSPEDEQYWSRPADLPPVYLRQRSWPAPEQSPAPRLPAHPAHPAPPRPHPRTRPTYPPAVVPETAVDTSDYGSPLASYIADAEGSLTDEQRRVLCSLPDAALLTLLRQLQRRARQPEQECRFCKNNGERESYYRSHLLKDASGRVRCPVLRAFVCRRCGARGDTAHTIKYCPLSTSEERIKSAAMLRSVRMASGRRRTHCTPAPPSPAAPAPELYDYPPHYPAPPATAPAAAPASPLDPLWAALEQKLSL